MRVETDLKFKTKQNVRVGIHRNMCVDWVVSDKNASFKTRKISFAYWKMLQQNRSRHTKKWTITIHKWCTFEDKNASLDLQMHALQWMHVLVCGFFSFWNRMCIISSCPKQLYIIWNGFILFISWHSFRLFEKLS